VSVYLLVCVSSGWLNTVWTGFDEISGTINSRTYDELTKFFNKYLFIGGPIWWWWWWWWWRSRWRRRRRWWWYENWVFIEMQPSTVETSQLIIVWGNVHHPYYSSLNNLKNISSKASIFEWSMVQDPQSVTEINLLFSRVQQIRKCNTSRRWDMDLVLYGKMSLKCLTN